MNIHQAAFNGNIKVLNEILESAPHHVNQILELKDDAKTYRITPIFFSAISGHLDALQLLLKHNALIRSPDESLELLKWTTYGKKPLAIGSLLIELSKQKDIHISQLANQTFDQFKTSSIALKTLLLNNSFEYDIDILYDRYYFLAGFKGEMSHLNEIIKYKCDLPTLTSIAVGAASNGKVEVLEFLHKEYEFNLSTRFKDDENNEYTLAFIAAKHGQVNVLQYLHRLHVDLEAPSSQGKAIGFNPAVTAAVAGHVNVLEYLHSIGVNLEAPISDGPARGQTPAYIAASISNINVLNCLHRLGVSLTTPVANITPACSAARLNHVEVLRFFYSIGINLATPLANGSMRGSTVSWFAAKNEACDTLKYLHSIGIDLTEPILEGPGKGYTIAALTSQFGLLETLKCLHSLGVNLTAPLADGKEKGLTPAYIAAKHDQLNILKFFSEDATWIDDGFLKLWKYLTPFHIALLTGKPEHVKALINPETPYRLTANDAEDKEWSLIEFIGQAYQEKYVSNFENILEICLILQERGLCNRDELLKIFKKNNFNLYKRLLTSPEKEILKVLSEKGLLKEILAYHEILPQGRALLRIENDDTGLQIKSADLADFTRAQIDLILSKDAPLYSPIKQKLAKLSSKKSHQGYQFKWEPHKPERVLRILEDLEKASVEISQMVAKSETFQRVAPATYTIIDAVDLSEEGSIVHLN